MGEQRLKNEVGCSADELIFQIASLVASETDESPVEMHPPLGAEIDGDALQQLVESAPDGLHVEFRYRGQDVVVETGSDVTIRTSRTSE